MCAKTKEEEMMVSKKSVFCRDCPQGKLAPRNWLFFCLFYFLSLQLKASCDLHASSKVQNKMSKIQKLIAGMINQEPMAFHYLLIVCKNHLQTSCCLDQISYVYAHLSFWEFCFFYPDKCACGASCFCLLCHCRVPLYMLLNHLLCSAQRSFGCTLTSTLKAHAMKGLRCTLCGPKHA